MSPGNSSPFDWQRFDRDHLWHPYTSMLEPLPVFAVVAASGVELELADGRRLVDGMSSWWAAIHGYNVPELNAALSTQAQRMSHVMFGGLAHQPAAELGRRLVAMTAEPLQYLFLADSGSVAVEVAIKMALQYWFAQGKQEKQRLLTVRGGYHGDTFGAMAVCDPVNGMHGLFHGVLPQHLFAPVPGCADDAVWDESHIAEFAQLLRAHRHEVAAVILEPLVQGAGGMRFYCPDYLRRVRALCDECDVLLILDEIATGFGRTGTLFAYEQAGIVPDILTLGKALTGGTLTLAATLTTERVARGIGADGSGVLMHGPTFMGNPLACAVANASIDLLLASPWQQRVAAIEAQLRRELAPCREFSCVREVRVKGAIGVIELTEAVDMRWVQPRLVELGVWIRPFGKLLYVMPPFVIEGVQLSRLTAAMGQVVAEIAAR
ncbi:MAG: adenosylmethionine--8-amino-7-oxononanoate transaminase [Gammaproteobacteria bacterium]|nr:adenosylmethionine--8-amino-7-oxononanoate transaminase [Gammaproteobacteria bacterium]